MSTAQQESWEAVGGHNLNMVRGHGDWGFWLGCVEHGYVARRIPETPFLYRMRAGTEYSVAVVHDREWRRQMRDNHPTDAGPRRFRRRLLKAGRRVARRIARTLRAARA